MMEFFTRATEIGSVEYILIATFIVATWAVTTAIGLMNMQQMLSAAGAEPLQIRELISFKTVIVSVVGLGINSLIPYLNILTALCAVVLIIMTAISTVLKTSTIPAINLE